MTDNLLTVLIADDEYWTRESLRTMLDWNAYGMRLTDMACDGEEALRILREQAVDILITDINMPYISGLELINRVREESPDTVIVVLSGYGDYEYVRQALVSGAMDYLLKPLVKTKLVELLGRAIEQRLALKSEKQSMAQIQQSLAQAAALILDRDFSALLHEAKHRELAQAAQAKLFEYEQQFAGYRLTLICVGAARGTDWDAYSVKTLVDSAFPAAPRLVIHNLYHPTHFLLVSPPDKALIDGYMPQVLKRLGDMTGMPARAIVSEAYLSFRELRMAYEETRAAFYNLPMRSGSALVYAVNQKNRAVAPRLSAAMQRQMEQAAITRQRAVFDRLLLQSGLLRAEALGWTWLETLHCLNAVAWILCRSVEEQGDPARQMTMETLMEVLPSSLAGEDERQGLLIQMEDEAFGFTLPTQPDGAQDAVQPVREYIDAHYVDELSLGSLSARFHLDESYLSRRFKQLAGVNLTLYIARKRVEQAKALLADNEASITEVAQTVGYDDYAYFSRVFKKLEGVSPRAYREGEAK